MPIAVVNRTKRLLVVAGGTATIFLLLFAPLPLPIRTEHREIAVGRALDSLLVGNRVMTNRGYRSLTDWSLVNSLRSSLYFTNRTDVSQQVFLARGLKPVDEAIMRLDLEQPRVVVIIVAAEQDDIEKSLVFNYHFSRRAAQGYKVRIYRSILLTYAVFHHRWVV